MRFFKLPWMIFGSEQHAISVFPPNVMTTICLETYKYWTESYKHKENRKVGEAKPAKDKS